MKLLDMREKPCPVPVIEAKKVLSQSDILGVSLIVDNIVAVQNLEKMAKGLGHEFTYETIGEDEYTVFIIKASSQGVSLGAIGAHNDTQQVKSYSKRGVTALITDEKMGTGNEDLGKILIKGFVFSLSELEIAPEAVIFLNAGVKLTVKGANTIEDLENLQSKGTSIKACGTCLNYYNLTEKLVVGEVVNMFDITTALDSATKIISL